MNPNEPVPIKGFKSSGTRRGKRHIAHSLCLGTKKHQCEFPVTLNGNNGWIPKADLQTIYLSKNHMREGNMHERYKYLPHIKIVQTAIIPHSPGRIPSLFSGIVGA